jgi:hypothetical protein
VAKAAQFIPQSEIPGDPQKISDNGSAEFLAKYPKDPRSHLIRAIVLASRNKLTPAESELREALALAEPGASGAPVRDSARLLLAVVLKAEGRIGEAKAMIAEQCQAKDRSAAKQAFEKAGLCD